MIAILAPRRYFTSSSTNIDGFCPFFFRCFLSVRRLLLPATYKIYLLLVGFYHSLVSPTVLWPDAYGTCVCVCVLVSGEHRRCGSTISNRIYTLTCAQIWHVYSEQPMLLRCCNLITLLAKWDINSKNRGSVVRNTMCVCMYDYVYNIHKYINVGENRFFGIVGHIFGALLFALEYNSVHGEYALEYIQACTRMLGVHRVQR